VDDLVGCLGPPKTTGAGIPELDLALQRPNDIFVALSWPLWALPYVFLAWTAIGIAWYQVIRRTRRT
jgi:hypothetical protein